MPNYSTIQTPVRHQGHRPTCVAFTLTAAHELITESATHFSVEHAFWAAKARDGGLPHTSGTTLPAALEGLIDEGSRSETVWPYGLPTWPPGPVPPAAALPVNIIQGIAGYESVALDFDEVVSKLKSGPVLLGLGVVSASWKAPGGVVDIVNNGKASGGHAVLAVASEPARDVIVVKNSWGTAWGDRGYGYITKRYFAQHIRAAFRVTDGSI